MGLRAALGGQWEAGDEPQAGAPAAGSRPPAPLAGRRGHAADAKPAPARSRNTAPSPQPPAGSPVAEAFSTVAHELRTPLATMQVSLEVLAEFGSLRPEEVQELIARLQRGVTWMDCLVENLATWAAVESDGLVLRRAPAPVLDWIAPALALVQPLLDRRDQRVELRCPDPPPIVEGDAARLGQAIVNLLVNAGKYSVWGDLLLVTVAGTDGGTVRVAVTDHGDGVLPAERQRIFRRRARGLAALSSGERGHGIGLAVVKAIVEAHGGTVGVESAYGQGATFWFTLPGGEGA